MKKDIQLIKDLKCNDHDRVNDAFEELYERYSKLVYFCINNIIHNYDDAIELTNDCFIRLFQKRDTLIAERNIKYYLTVSARNIAIDFLRKTKNQYLRDDDIIASFKSIDHDKEYYEIMSVLKDYLNDDEIEIVILHLVYGYTFKEIAELKQCNLNTITSRYQRALKKVKTGDANEKK